MTIAIVRTMTPCSGTYYSVAVVPAECVLSVCLFRSWLGGTPVWSEAGHQVFWDWSLLEGASIKPKVHCCLCQAWSH